MTRGRIGETYNIGGGAEMPNIRVVEMICDILDRLQPDPGGRCRRDLITFVKDRPGHDRRYAIDASKARRTLAWHPRTSFANGIETTIRWYLEHSGVGRTGQKRRIPGMDPRHYGYGRNQ